MASTTEPGNGISDWERIQLDAGRTPTIIADDVHVTYRTFASGRQVRGAAGRGGLLSRGVAGIREVHANRGISFVAFEGEAVGVIGHNGSGKSTLLSAITGLLPVTSGSVWASAQPALLGVGSVLMPQLPGAKNVYLGQLALGASPAEARERYDEIVDFSGIGEFIEYPMRTYSSGMSSRLQFAIAASRNHAILLIDEALGVGDKKFRVKSEARIRELKESAGTVMLVSHSMSSILDTSTRVIWIDKGLVKMNGDPQEVVAAYEAHVDANRDRPGAAK